MFRVVVFGGGRGGEAVAEYLEEELGVVEVVRAIDWSPAVEEVELLARAERDLVRFWGRGVTIVLADGAWAQDQLWERLRARHPGQSMVRMGISWRQVKRCCPSDGVVVALSTRMQNESWGAELREKLPKLTWMWPDGRSWGELIDQDLMTGEILRRDLKRDFGEALNHDDTVRARRQARLREAEVEVSIREVSPGAGRAHLTLAQTITLEKHRVKLVATLAKLTEFKERQAKERELQLLRREPREVMSVWPGEDTEDLAELRRPSTVLLMDARLWAWRSEIEQIFGWRAQVLDCRRKLFRDTCVALGLLGVDGKSGRET